MTAGEEFILAVIAENKVDLFDLSSAANFVAEEKELYNYVKSYLSSYKRFPTRKVLRLAHVLPQGDRSTDTAEFWYDRICTRTQYNVVNKLHPSFVDAIKKKDMVQVGGILNRMRDELAIHSPAREFTTLLSEVEKVYEDYRTATTVRGIQGIATPWEALNNQTGGFTGEDLVVLAGRSSIGKSWLLMEMAIAAHLAGHRIGFVSMEMTLSQIARRWAGRRAMFNPNQAKHGQMSTWTERRFLDFIEMLRQEESVHLHSGAKTRTVDDIKAFISKNNLSACYIDAAYFLRPTSIKSNFGMKKHELLSEMVHELKQYGLEKAIPIIISVQFNRNAKADQKRESEQGDVAGTDSFFQDASIVIAPKYGSGSFGKKVRIMELMKNREGETNNFGINFELSPPDFSEVPLDEEGEPQVEQESANEWM